MKRLKQLMLLTGSILIVLLPKKIVNACGFYVAPGEYRFWLLQPDLTNSNDLTPFFFASTYLYKGNQHPGEPSHIQENVKEWYEQLKGKATTTDIDTVLNGTNPALFFDSTASLARKNSFLRNLLKPDNKELYDYLVLSKKVEDVAAHPDPWGEENFPVSNISNVIKEARALHHKTNSPFIKLRTAYQLIRLYSYNGQANEIGKTYDALIAPVKSGSWIKTAALYQKAMADTSDTDYLLSKVFDRGNYNRVTCLVNFNSSELATTLTKAKNAHERTVLYAMKVFNYPGRSLSYIRNVYNAEPNYKELPFLLLREINKVEDWLVTPKVTGFSPAVYNGQYWWYEGYDEVVNYNNDKVYAKQLYDFIKEVIKHKKSNNTLLNLYAAHLSMLQGNYNVSQQHLSSIKDVGLPANIQTQLRINKLLLYIQTDKTISTNFENEFISIISTPAKELGVYDPEIMKDQLILYVGRKMIEKGYKAKGLMLLGKTRRALGDLPIGDYKQVYQEMEEIAEPEDYDAIIEILDKKNKTPFENFVSGKQIKTPAEYYEDEEYYEYGDTMVMVWDRNKVLDCKASWFIRNRDLEAASRTLQQIPNTFWKQEPYKTYIGGDPFYLNVNSAHKITPDDKINCNKKEVISRMLNLYTLAKRDASKAAECYYQLANAYYNMSWHGKNWLMVKQWWTSGETSGYNVDIKRTSFNDDYYGTALAKEYYLKAFKVTKDQKLATLCCYMAGQCDQNFKQYIWNIKNKGNYDAHFTPSLNPYIKALRQKGIDESYYKEMINECATYISYIKQYNKRF